MTLRDLARHPRFRFLPEMTIDAAEEGEPPELFVVCTIAEESGGVYGARTYVDADGRLRFETYAMAPEDCVPVDTRGTRAGLLDLVREHRGDLSASVHPYWDDGCLVWDVQSGQEQVRYCYGRGQTEIEALIAALTQEDE